jgi:hypothetical protein
MALSMVRRHRIQEDELPYVMNAVYLRLAELHEGEIKVETEALFRVLWRFHRHRKGPPAYPEQITRTEIMGILHDLIDLY